MSFRNRFIMFFFAELLIWSLNMIGRIVCTRTARIIGFKCVIGLGNYLRHWAFGLCNLTRNYVRCTYVYLEFEIV